MKKLRMNDIEATQEKRVGTDGKSPVQLLTLRYFNLIIQQDEPSNFGHQDWSVFVTEHTGPEFRLKTPDLAEALQFAQDYTR